MGNVRLAIRWPPIAAGQEWADSAVTRAVAVSGGQGTQTARFSCRRIAAAAWLLSAMGSANPLWTRPRLPTVDLDTTLPARLAGPNRTVQGSCHFHFCSRCKRNLHGLLLE